MATTPRLVSDRGSGRLYQDDPHRNRGTGTSMNPDDGPIDVHFPKSFLAFLSHWNAPVRTSVPLWSGSASPRPFLRGPGILAQREKASQGELTMLHIITHRRFSKVPT